MAFERDSEGRYFLFCDGCEYEIPNLYMLKDEVWAATGFQVKENACLKCVVERLGRYLTVEDFTRVPQNAILFATIPGAQIPTMRTTRRAFNDRVLQGQ